MLSNLFGPLIATPPAKYAEIPVYLAANKESRGKGLEFSNEKLKALGKPTWCEDRVYTTQLWDRLRGMLEK